MAYEDVLAKLARAEKHIEDLAAAINGFRGTHRDNVGKRVEEHIGTAIYYVKSVPVVPDEISLILGDALYNLRSTLDYLAHAVVRPTEEKAIRKTSFPIADSEEEYRVLADRVLEGVRPFCKEKFDRLRPYKGGGVLGHYLWQLHKLNNIDKHRLLLTATFALSARSLTPSELEKANAKFNRFGNVQRLSIPHYLIDAAPPHPGPLQDGQTLLVVDAAEAEHPMGFSFDVAIYEPGVIETTSALLLLGFIASEVQSTINDLIVCATV